MTSCAGPVAGAYISLHPDSVTCTSLCWTRGAGGRVQRGRGCVCASVCVVGGGGGEECLVCADDNNMKGGEGSAQLIVRLQIKPKSI